MAWEYSLHACFYTTEQHGLCGMVLLKNAEAFLLSPSRPFGPCGNVDTAKKIIEEAVETACFE